MDLQALYRQRNHGIAAIRRFFVEQQFVEVDTPLVVACPGFETYQRYFATDYADLREQQRKLFLRASPELHMKQLLAHGMQRIFQIGKCFRNVGELGSWHHPEFTMLEWYQCGIGFDDFIDQTAQLIQTVAQDFARNHLVAPSIIDEAKNWQKITVAEAFKRFAGLDLVDLDAQLAPKARFAGVISVKDEDDFDTAFFKILLEKIEPNLAKMGLCALYDYPASHAILAQVQNGCARRVEFYWRGVELSNGFLELDDEALHLQRFQAVNQQRAHMGIELLPLDPGFFAAVKSGWPMACGNAMGVERLLAVLQGQDSLQQQLAFRTPFAGSAQI